MGANPTPPRPSLSSLTSPAARPGGRTARTRKVVLDAAIEQLLDGGLVGFSVGAVAARSGVHPSTIYRRWGTRERLAVDALLDRVDAAIPIPDTGALATDVRQLLGDLAAFYGTRLGAVVGHLAMAPLEDPAAEGVRQLLWDTRLREVEAIVERAAARGEIGRRVDPRSAVEALLAQLHLHVLTLGHPADAPTLDAFTRAAVAAVRALDDAEPR
ncbi:MAG TPA: TetR/AcrR family transcriptional regulator [Acidimicrobiales bacterium]